MRKVFLGSILLLLVALLKLPTWAGTPNATVTGTVYSGGKQLAGVTVRLINPSIGFSQAQTTGDDGGYTFTNVPPAEDYVISVEMAGFATQVLSGLIVQVGEEKLVVPPFLLQPSAPAAAPAATPPVAAPAATPPVAAPSATPPAAAPSATTLVTQKITPPSVSLDLLSSTMGGVIDSREVHTLPLVNRDFIDLALLVPGTYPVEQGSVLLGASLVVNGARADMNNFLLDGADNNDYTINQSLPFQIVEALQEFRVQASTEDAEYGRSGGAQINELSRSGSNSVHGELFEFNRVSALSAGNFFSAFSGGGFDQYASELNLIGAGNPLADPTLSALYNDHNPRLDQNQFGGNLGGALIKDKLFGFFNWESFRLVNPRPLFEEVPGTAFRSVASCEAALGTPCDQTAVNLFNIYPGPSVPTVPGFSDPTGLLFNPCAPIQNCFTGDGAFNTADASNSTSSDNFLGRIDLRATSRTSMSFKYNIQRIDELQAGNTPPSPTYPGNGTLVNGRNQNFSYSWVQQISSRTTSELRFGWNRFRLTTTAQDAGLDPATLGFVNPNPNIAGVPTINIGSEFGAGSTFAPDSSLGAGFATPSNRADNLFSVAENLSLTRGRHTWKLGAEFRDVRLNVNNDALGRGELALFSVPLAAEFGVSEIASIARACPGSLAAAAASACSGATNSFARHFATESAGVYVQDQWRIRHNFTLNYGVRYELNSAPVEKQNLLVNFYPGLNTNIGAGSGGLIQGGSRTIFDPFGDMIGALPAAGPAAPRAGYKTDRYDWGPRLGFAWDPWSNGKTVIRGGYALMFDQPSLEASVNQLLNPPFVQQNLSGLVPSQQLLTLGASPFALLSDTFSACAPFLQVGTGGCLSTSTNQNSGSTWFQFPYSITAINPHNKSPYVHQFHLGIEQELGNRALFSIAYVGAAAHKLPALGDISPCSTTAFLASSSSCFSGAGQSQANPFLFTTILDEENAADSNFNSIQFRFETREFHGLRLRAFYTFAKSIDDASSQQPQVFLISPLISSAIVSETFDNPGAFDAANNISPTLSLQGNFPLITTHPNLPQSGNNLAGERALSDFDIRHRFVFDYIYSVPRWAPGIGTGWQLAGITTLQSGQPFTVFIDSFGTPLRPDVFGAVPLNLNNPTAAIDNGIPMTAAGSIFNLTPTSPTATLSPGALGRNAFTGPKFINFDFAVLKDTRLPKTERANVQFKVELFNLFNNVNFHQPYSRGGLAFFDFNVGGVGFFPDPFFGQILQAYPARQIQFALKFQF
jgi:Carboxypeptidase regulatory-like domain/TonB dependent receptor